MDDAKRENNKIKRSKGDVKNVVSGYLQKRNYSTFVTFECSKNQQLTYSLVENGVGRSNSVLYSCYNTDPIVIDHNFTKFLIWLKDQTRHRNRCYDIEHIVGPLFCHLYMDILRGEHSERAATFFECHLPAIDKNKCDNTVQDLISLFATDSESGKLKEKFRSKKTIVELNYQSLLVLKKFVLESCHNVFLQVLQTWFDFRGNNDRENGLKDKVMPLNNHHRDAKFQELISVIKNVRKEPLPIYNIKISNNKLPISCGLLKRQCGLVAFAEFNVLRLMPIHCLDSLFNTRISCEQIKLTNHSGQIYSIAVSPSNDILISGAADHSICIYSLVDFILLHKCTGHSGPVYCVKISSNGQFVATASMDCTARLWDVKTGKTLRVFAGHTQAITCLDFHPNCLYIATGSADRNIRLWSLSKATPLRLFHAAKGSVYALAFNPTGRLLATASEDKKIRIWDLLTAKIIAELRCKDSPVVRIIWCKDGTELCAATVEGVLRMWDFASIEVHSENNRYHEPVSTQSLNAKLLSLEYTFGTYGALTM